MNIGAILTKVTGLFKEKIELFAKNENLDTLTPETGQKIVDEIYEISNELGLESLKLIFEQYDLPESKLKIDDTVYYKKKNEVKKILTPMGYLQLNRNIYQKNGKGPALIPMDDKLGIRGENMFPRVKEALLFSCAHNTPEETQMIIEKLSPYQLHASAIKRMINKTVPVMNVQMEAIKNKIYQQEPAHPEAEVLVVSMDGVNLLLDEKGKKKGRPSERPGVQKTKETPTSYKNAMCGSFSYYRAGNKQEEEHTKRLSSNYIARMPEDRYPTFKKEFEREIRHHTEGFDKPKVLLCDGHKSIWGYVESTELYNDFEKMIDYFHALEHLSKLSENIFGKSSAQGQTWYNKMKKKLKLNDNGVEQVISSGIYYINTRKLSKGMALKSQKELNYFVRNKGMMRYANFIEKGWPIGSGVIEAACKSIVKQRMCRSGQRWSRIKGQHILSLRALVKSGRWDQAWSEFNNINNAA